MVFETRSRGRRPQLLIVLLAAMSLSARALAQADPLPSWNDGAAKTAITAFVQETTSPGPKFVAPEARVATFDQDGTLWVEHPMYTQLLYSLDKVPAVVAKKPELGDGARLAVLVLHDDATREYAYGPARGLPDSKVGAFTQALYDEAQKETWVVISMKSDWKRIFAFEP